MKEVVKKFTLNEDVCRNLSRGLAVDVADLDFAKLFDLATQTHLICKLMFNCLEN